MKYGRWAVDDAGMAFTVCAVELAPLKQANGIINNDTIKNFIQFFLEVIDAFKFFLVILLTALDTCLAN